MGNTWPSDSRVPILYHESKSVEWVFIYIISPSLYNEFKSIPWVILYIISPSIYHYYKSVPWLQVYNLISSFYHVSNSIPWVQVNTINQILYHEYITFRKKYNFTSEQILISNHNKSNFALAQIPLHIWTNPISQWNEYNFTLEQILFHIGTNPVSTHIPKPVYKIFLVQWFFFLRSWSKIAQILTKN